jgi:hypothetical protein
MKKLITILGCAAGFFLIAAPIYMNQPNMVFINNKPFATALTINGIIAVSVEDFAKAVGGGGTLRVQGNRLALIAPALQASSPAGSSFTPAGAAGGGGSGHNTSAATGGAGAGNNAIGSATGGAGAGKVNVHEFTITKTSDTASPLIMKDGKAFVALTDVARLFGGTFNNAISGNLRPGQRIDLTFSGSPAALIAVH